MVRFVEVVMNTSEEHRDLQAQSPDSVQLIPSFHQYAALKHEMNTMSLKMKRLLNNHNIGYSQLNDQIQIQPCS